jgi:hypothetical protein
MGFRADSLAYLFQFQYHSVSLPDLRPGFPVRGAVFYIFCESVNLFEAMFETTACGSLRASLCERLLH